MLWKFINWVVEVMFCFMFLMRNGIIVIFIISCLINVNDRVIKVEKEKICFWLVSIMYVGKCFKEVSYLILYF